MNQQVILNRIRTLLARFQEEVTIDNANGEFSINLHAENLLLKMLNTAYDWELRNVNYEAGKTFAAIDLRDDEKKVAVQISSSGTVDKVVHTLEQCVDKGYDTKYEHLYFYFLKGMDKNVKVDYPRIARSLGQYRPECVHFLDHAGFYLELNRLNDLEKCRQIKTLLEEQFTDLPLGGPEQQKKAFTNKDLIVPFTQGSSSGAQGNTYVPRHDLLSKIATCYDSQAGKKRIVFLSGMGGCGKSELARAYADAHKGEYEEIFWLTCGDGEALELMALFSAAKTNYTVEKSYVANLAKEILIIVDNCNTDAPGFLHDLMNGTGNADILVTTRLPIMGDYDEQMVAVESDDPERFAFAVFEKNYCKKPRWGRRKEIGVHEKTAVLDICREVQCNTMIVSLIGVRLREYNNLSIFECAEKIRGGISALYGKITYLKNLEKRTEDMKEILCFLFSDILNYPLTEEQRDVLTILSLTPASWYEIDYIVSLAGDSPQNTEHVSAATALLEYGWIQGADVRMTIHPLIAEVLFNQAKVRSEPTFYSTLLINYLGLQEKYLNSKKYLINKILERADMAASETRMVAMLLLNHIGYRKSFSVLYPDVNAAYFVYTTLCGTRYYSFRDLEKNETHPLVSVPCSSQEPNSIFLLKVYNNHFAYKLDLNVSFNGLLIEHIPSGLCYNDCYLHDLILPDSIKSIGNDAFEGCEELSCEIHLPKALTYIGTHAFSRCWNMTGQLHFPEELTSIGDFAFYGCEGLSGDLYLPDNLTYLGASAFECCCGFTGNLHLSKNLKIINKMVFALCDGFKGKLVLPEGLISIGFMAFSRCSGFTGELDLPESLKIIEMDAFLGCEGLTGNLKLPESLERIEASAFQDCAGLSGELQLPKGLKYIGESAFMNCTGICIDVGYIDTSHIVIEKTAFDGCNSLRMGTSINKKSIALNIAPFYNFLFGNDTSPFYTESRKRLTISNEINQIKDYAYNGCTGLIGELHFPQKITSIGVSAFAGCSGLTGGLYFSDKITYIGAHAFQYCTGLNGELHLPKSIKIIKDMTFYGCTGLTGYLYLPDSVLRVEANAFTGCSGLTGNPYLSKCLTVIEDEAFAGCSGLSGELHLPHGLLRIGAGAFGDCFSLTGNLYIPEGLTEIGNRAFCGCTGLNGQVYLPKSLLSIGWSAFSGCNDLAKLVFLSPSTLIDAPLDPYSLTVISGPRNSTAEKYARENGFVFEELTPEDK